MIESCIVEEYPGGKKRAYDALEREVSTQTDLTGIAIFPKSLLRAFIIILHSLFAVFRSITGSRIFTRDMKSITNSKI